MSEHATELRDRSFKESFCVQPGCQYEGQAAVQGHCFSRLDDETDRRITKMMADAESSLAFYKEHPGDDYVKTLESMYVCAMSNWSSTLDSLVWLRRENADLKAKLAAPEPAR